MTLTLEYQHARNTIIRCHCLQLHSRRVRYKTDSQVYHFKHLLSRNFAIVVRRNLTAIPCILPVISPRHHHPRPVTRAPRRLPNPAAPQISNPTSTSTSMLHPPLSTQTFHKRQPQIHANFEKATTSILTSTLRIAELRLELTSSV